MLFSECSSETPEQLTTLRERARELTEMFDKTVRADAVPIAHMQKLTGKLRFAQSPVFARYGRVALQPLNEFLSEKRWNFLREGVRRLKMFVSRTTELSPPRNHLTRRGAARPNIHGRNGTRRFCEIQFHREWPIDTYRLLFQVTAPFGGNPSPTRARPPRRSS